MIRGGTVVPVFVSKIPVQSNIVITRDCYFCSGNMLKSLFARANSTDSSERRNQISLDSAFFQEVGHSAAATRCLRYVDLSQLPAFREQTDSAPTVSPAGQKYTESM